MPASAGFFQSRFNPNNSGEAERINVLIQQIYMFKGERDMILKYVFIHGTAGWGSYDKRYEKMPYWGMRGGDSYVPEKGMEPFFVMRSFHMKMLSMITSAI